MPRKTTSSPGWTLRYAARETARQEWEAWVAACRAFRAAGWRRKHTVIGPGIWPAAEFDFQAAGQKRKLVRAEKIALQTLKGALREQLSRGALIAMGRRGSPLAQLDVIPASAWRELVFASLTKSVVKEARSQTFVHDVRVFRSGDLPRDLKDVANSLAIDVEPDAKANAADSERDHGDKAAAPREACNNWLCDAMRASPADRHKPKSDWFSEAKQKWPTLARRTFDRAWDDALEDTGSQWGAPGRTRGRGRKSSQ